MESEQKNGQIKKLNKTTIYSGIESYIKLAITIISTLCSCAAEPQVYVFEPSHANVELYVTLTSCNEEKVDLKLAFNNDDSIRIVLDAMAYTTECYYYKDEKHLSSFIEEKGNNINALFDRFEFSQALIENEEGELKLLSSVTEKFTVRDFNTGDCIGSWIAVKSGKKVVFKVSDIFMEDLQIRETDEKLRLYYLFKGDSLKGYDDILIRSNWFLVECP